MTEFIVHNAGLVALIPATVIIVLWFVFSFTELGAAHRRKQFQARPTMTRNEWFARNMPGLSRDSEEVIESVLKALAKEIGVSWSQLSPEDTFERHLRLQGRFAEQEDLDQAEEEILQILEAKGIDAAGGPGFRGSLGGFLNSILDDLQNQGAQVADPSSELTS